MIRCVKERILDQEILDLLKPSVYNPTPEKLLNRANKYKENGNAYIYAFEEGGKYKGIVVFDKTDKTATILDIAVKEEYRRQGIGTKLIDFIFDKFHIDTVRAETDDDAVEFYKKYGFITAEEIIKFNTKRYLLIKEK